TARAEWTYEVNVLAAADAALSQRIETLKADVGNNSAAITAEAVARAGADAALASDISSLGATVGNNSAAIQLEATARANADSALEADIATLDAKVFDPDTGLPSVASAVDALSTYAGPDGALADAITSLSASTTPGEVNEANFRMQAVAGPTGYSRIA